MSQINFNRALYVHGSELLQMADRELLQNGFSAANQRYIVPNEHGSAHIWSVSHSNRDYPLAELATGTQDDWGRTEHMLGRLASQLGTTQPSGELMISHSYADTPREIATIAVRKLGNNFARYQFDRTRRRIASNAADYLGAHFLQVNDTHRVPSDDFESAESARQQYTKLEDTLRKLAAVHGRTSVFDESVRYDIPTREFFIEAGYRQKPTNGKLVPEIRMIFHPMWGDLAAGKSFILTGTRMQNQHVITAECVSRTEWGRNSIALDRKTAAQLREAVTLLGPHLASSSLRHADEPVLRWPMSNESTPAIAFAGKVDTILLGRILKAA
jgi:hypothetical protein